MNNTYFIAILLPERVLSQVEALKMELLEQFNLKGALRSPAHITLHRPFEWKQEKEDELIEKLNEFKFNKDFEIVLKDFNCFEPRVIYVDVVNNELLGDLHDQLKYFAQKKLHLFNEVNDERGFHPHVTIAFRDLKKHMFQEVWSCFKDRKFDDRLLFGGITLLKLQQRWEVLHQFSCNK